jgi:hypothetical protein
MAIAGLLGGAGVGCLVTDTIEFDGERNTPPMIFDAPFPVAKIGDWLWIDKSARTMFELRVKVREPNVNEPLLARWRVVSKNDPEPPFDQKEVARTGEEVRDLAIDVQTDVLHDGECALLELAVSGSFEERRDPQFFASTNSEDDRDLAIVMWTIWEGEGPPRTTPEEKARLITSCPSNEKLLLTPLTPAPPMETTP